MSTMRGLRKLSIIALVDEFLLFFANFYLNKNIFPHSIEMWKNFQVDQNNLWINEWDENDASVAKRFSLVCINGQKKKKK